jgi:peroxiredoxin
MMSGLNVAIAVAGVLCLANLALTFTLVRRVRRQDERIAAAPRFRAGTALPPGSTVGDFTAITAAGEPRSLEGLAGGRALVAFFSASCSSCRKQLPEFLELARTIPGGAGQVLAVVAGEEKASAEFAVGLGEEASVVFEQPHGPLSTAFSVRGFPSFYLVGADGRIESSGLALAALVRPAAT